MRRTWNRIKSSLRLFLTDLSAFRWLLLIPLIPLAFIIGDTESGAGVEADARAWRFGFLAQQWLIIPFFFWTFIPLQRWYTKEEEESLRAADVRHSSVPGLVWTLILEMLGLIPVMIWGYCEKLELTGELIRILLYQMLFTAVIYLLTVLSRSVVLAFAAAAIYCLFCNTFGRDRYLQRFCLLRPGTRAGTGRMSADILTVIRMWPVYLISVVVFILARRIEKRRVLFHR